jgi:methylglutaconyl-CoA hydratase
MADIILLEKQKDIYLLTLNRPEKRNALSPELVAALHREIDNIQADKNCKVLIITGAGKAFCAGADLAYLQELSRYDESENLADSQNLAHLFDKIYQLPQITISMVNGPALAGGCGLANCCDYIFAETDASFGFTEVRIGFVPAIVMNFLIRKIPLNEARHLAISGEIISASVAREKGMVYQTYDMASLREETMAFAEKLFTANSFQAMMQTKKLFQSLLDLPLSEGLKLASEINTRSRKSEDCQKGLHAFLNKQKLQWRD